LRRSFCRIESGVLSAPSAEGFRIAAAVLTLAPQERRTYRKFLLPILSFAAGWRRISSRRVVHYHGLSRHIDSDINDQYRTLQRIIGFIKQHRPLSRLRGCLMAMRLRGAQKTTRLHWGLSYARVCVKMLGTSTQVCVLPEHRGRRIAIAHWDGTQETSHPQLFLGLSLTVTEDQSQGRRSLSPPGL